MKQFNSIYDILPKNFCVTDKGSNVVYGKELKDGFASTFESTLVLSENEYTIKYFFPEKTKELAEHFSAIFDVLLSLIKNENPKTNRIFAYIYTFLRSIIESEITSGAKFTPLVLDDDAGATNISEKGFVATFGIITHYIGKNGQTPCFSYSKDYQCFKVFLDCEDKRCNIPKFLQDYCSELAKRSGFSIEFSDKQDQPMLTATLVRACSTCIIIEEATATFDLLYLICELLV